MLSKLRQTRSRSGQKRRFGLFSKMTFSDAVSPYERMEHEVKAGAKKAKVLGPEEGPKEQGNRVTLAQQEVHETKKAKKKKSWKRIRQAALATCRYIGMGAAHMSPATMYSYPDYYVDPKCWNKSFNPNYKPKNPPNQTPHWTNNLMFAGW